MFAVRISAPMNINVQSPLRWGSEWCCEETVDRRACGVESWPVECRGGERSDRRREVSECKGKSPKSGDPTESRLSVGSDDFGPLEYPPSTADRTARSSLSAPASTGQDSTPCARLSDSRLAAHLSLIPSSTGTEPLIMVHRCRDLILEHRDTIESRCSRIKSRHL